MGRFYRVTSLFFVLATMAASARAENALTEEQFLAVLSEDHPVRVGLTGRLAAAEGARAQSGRFANLRLGAAWELPEETTQQSTWSLAWVPPLDGRRGLRIRASEAALDAARADLESEELGVRAAMRAVFADWAIGAERRSLAAAHLEKVRRLVSQIRARAETGEESGLAMRRLELAAIEIEAISSKATAAEATARRRASAWWAAADDVMPVRPDLPQPPSEIDLASKPEIRAREREVAQAEYESRLAGRYLGFPELEAGWQKQEDPAEQSFEGPVFGLAWDLPLFDRQQGSRAEAERRLAAARARLEFSMTMARAELEGAQEAYSTLRESALRSMESVAGTDALIESAAASYSFGESSLTDFLDTLRSVLTSRLAALDLYTAALEAHRNLEAAAGRPLTIVSGGQ